MFIFVFFFSSRRRHTRYWRDWSSDVCSSDLRHANRHDGDQDEERGADVPASPHVVAACTASAVTNRTIRWRLWSTDVRIPRLAAAPPPFTRLTYAVSSLPSSCTRCGMKIPVASAARPSALISCPSQIPAGTYARVYQVTWENSARRARRLPPRPP